MWYFLAVCGGAADASIPGTASAPPAATPALMKSRLSIPLSFPLAVLV
jgi:hypothetical protein